MDERLHVLIVANDPLARAGIATLLADLPDCHVVGQVTATELTAVSADELTTEEPDVVIWDLGWETAVSHVETVYAFIQEKGFDGTDEPFEVYLTLYHVLTAQKDLRAEKILRYAYDELMEKVTPMIEPSLRQDALHNNPAQHQILALVAERAESFSA